MRYRSGDLLSYAVLTLTLHLNGQVDGGGVCKDSQGRTYETGHLFIPEPCTVCICDNGNPKWCKEVICTLSQKPMSKQDCKSFRMDGTPCCEFICLDNTLSSVTNDKTDGMDGSGDASASYDLGLRLVASCFTAILSLSLLFFLIHRLRQRKIRVCVAGRQSRQLGDETRSLGSIGYLDRGGLPHGMQMDDLACGGGYPLWKPPGNYFPRGEAPPPYEEAVAAARAEQALLTMSPHALSPLNLPNTYLTTHSSVTLLAANPNLPANSPTPSNHGASPSSSVSGSRPLSAVNPHCHQGDSVSPGFYNSSTSFSIGNGTYENLPTPVPLTNINMATPQHSNNNVNPPQTPSTCPPHQSHVKNYHTTLPRQGSAFTISATLPSASVSTHRTIPRTLATSSNLRLRRDFLASKPVAPLFGECNLMSDQPRSAPPIIPSTDSATQSEFYDNSTNNNDSAAVQTETTGFAPCDKKPPPILTRTEANQDGSFDSFTCNCSMQALPTLHDDTDDYRSECENCKSATGSRYYLDNEDELVTSPHETMTLHRRPEETAASVTPQYYRTSLTLPTNTRQRTRTTGGRGNWIMPESSTESSDDD